MDLYEKKQLRYRYIFSLVLVACITCVVSASLTYYFLGEKAAFSSLLLKGNTDENSSSEETIDAIGKSLKSFRNVIDEYYIGDIDESKLLDGAIKGYVEGLEDEYSEYMTAEEWNEFQLSALGNYVGIGIYMSVNSDGNIEIARPLNDSPAEKAGIKTGDVIVEVDGENVLGMESSLVSSKVKGEAGTTVHIKMARGNEYMEYDIVREEIKLYHVESEMKNNNVGYISLLTFDEGCSDEVEEAIKELEQKGAKKFILDLRYNTGGLVDEALKIANFFIPKGNDILITEDASKNRTITKTELDNITDKELVVLINGYSASASEILVGALKDNGKAITVGENSYGKGVIQNVFNLLDGSVLKLTIAEYFTPNGTKIHKVGIKPDYEIELPDVDEDDAKFEDTQLNKALELLK